MKHEDAADIFSPLDDRQSLEQLQAIVGRYCLSLTGSTHDAEDLAQDTWLKAFMRLKNVGHTHPEAFLLRIAKNTWIDQCRRQSALTRILRKEQLQVSAPEAGCFEIEAAFQAILKHLSPLQRAVFLLRDVFGYSAAETAQMLQSTEGAVKAALSRARHSIDAVKHDLEMDALALPEEEETRSFLRAIAAAYQIGDIFNLVHLVLRSDMGPLLAISAVQNLLAQPALTHHRAQQSKQVGPPQMAA